MSDATPSRRGFLAAGAGLAATNLSAEAMPPDQPRELAPQSADMGSLFPDLRKLAESKPFAMRFAGDRFKDHAEFKATAREKIFDVLSYRPEKVDPKPEVIDRVDRGDHVREKVLFNTTPLFRVPAYVLIPKNLKGPAPAIVDLHSHGGMFLFGKEKVIDLGDNHAAMTEYHKKNYDGRPTATELVKRGYVVISIDAFMFGERRYMADADLKHGWDRSKYTLEQVRELNQQCRGRETTLAKSMAFAGATWPGVVFWDDIRTVDYLVTRPEVDPKRIGCVGISMGGYRSIYLSALDDRIAAGVIVGFMSSVRPMMQKHVDTHSWVHFLPGLHQHLDLPDVSTIAAPRNLMVQQCRQDGLFPLAGMEESLKVIAAGYAKAGCDEKFVGRFYDERHIFTQAMQNDAFTWFDEKLKG